MDLNWRTLALALAAGVLGWVFGNRDRIIMAQPGPPSYQAMLYSLHVRVVDSETGEVLPFRIFWKDRNHLSPFAKGSGPGKIEEFSDGSQAIHLVGLPLANGLALEITAEGYDSQTVTVRGHSGGIGTDQPDDVMPVKLVKRSAGVPAAGQPVQPAPGRD